MWRAEYSSDAVSLAAQEESLNNLKVHEREGLSPDWWRRVEQLLAEVRFDELPPTIRQTPGADGTITVMTDDAILCIETRTPPKHRVCGATLDIKRSADGKRFAVLWNYLVAAVPDLADSETISR
jgi:hypothetical protein